MAGYPVGELKANFSDVLDRVCEGEEIEIYYGRAKAPVAKIVPIRKTGERRLGILNGKAKASFKGEWSMSAEELLGL
jgi:prevent-host-death family protein